MKRFWILVFLLANVTVVHAGSPLLVEGHAAPQPFVSWANGYGALAEDRRHVAVFLSPEDARRVHPGLTAEVRFGADLQTETPVSGKVSDVLAEADPHTGQAIATIAIAPVTREPRSYVSVRIPVNARTALGVPTRAVIWESGKARVVRRVGENDYAAVDVTVGRQDTDFTEIIGGISISDTILVEGAIEWQNRGQAGEE